MRIRPVNLAEILTASPTRDAEHIAVKLDDFELNYGLLEQAAMRARRHAARPRGRARRPRRADAARTSRISPSLYYGILRAGASSCR